MVHVDIHGRVELHRHVLQILPCELVGLVNGLGFPVRPINVVLEDGDGERVFDVLTRREDDVTVISFEIRTRDDVQFGVNPVETVHHVVWNKRRSR